MIIDNLNLNLIRVFESVYRTRSMTKAAKELHMTQSGVSQNIRNLEDVLEFTLFDRIKQRPVPTKKASILYEQCSENLYSLEKVLAELKGEEQILRGQVSIGIPIEFGNNLVLPLLVKWGEAHPEISYRIRYGYAAEMNLLLLNGELDFAFVDTYGFDKQIITKKVSDETLTLCASKDYIKRHGGGKPSKKFFESLDYIDYVEDAPLLRMWFKHHYDWHNLNSDIRASLMDVQGMSRMIVEGLGLGILPLHVVKKLKAQGHEFHLFKGSGKPLLNAISIAYLEGRTNDPAIIKTRTFLEESLKKK